MFFGLGWSQARRTEASLNRHGYFVMYCSLSVDTYLRKLRIFEPLRNWPMTNSNYLCPSCMHGQKPQATWWAVFKWERWLEGGGSYHQPQQFTNYCQPQPATPQCHLAALGSLPLLLQTWPRRPLSPGEGSGFLSLQPCFQTVHQSTVGSLP